MADIAFELLLLLGLLLANGCLALSEIAVVSARRPRLAQQAERGNASARAALALSESPTRFLSTVQVGITLIGILSGAVGGAAIAEKLGAALSTYPWLAEYGDAVAFAIVVIGISYLSVIVGELVPKGVALSHPERFAALVAKPMTLLARVAGPAVTALELTSNLVMTMFRLPQGGDNGVTQADVSAMVAAGTAQGVFDPVERRIVERTFRLDDEPVAAMMTPRTEIVWLDANEPVEMHIDLIRQHPFTRFPVCDGSLDRILGMVTVRDIWLAQQGGSQPDLRALIRQPLFVPDRSSALTLLHRFQSTGTHVAIVIDEHGGVDGLLTLNNLLSFLVEPTAGVVERREDPGLVERAPGSWLVDGALSLGDLYATVGIDDPGADRPRPYHTLAGLIMTRLGRIPAAGDRVEEGPLVIEVADMDGFRVDKVLVSRTDVHSPP